jgi:hypothetical protein
VLLLGGSFMHLSLSGLYWMSLFNPDQEDPIQRVYGGIFSMLTMLVLAIPGGAVLGVSVLLHLPIALRVALVLAMNWGIARLAQWQAARKYANFVFSE